MNILGMRIITSPHVPATRPVTRIHRDWRARLARNCTPRGAGNWLPWEPLDYEEQVPAIFLMNGQWLTHPRWVREIEDYHRQIETFYKGKL